ncbi:hypothetical protein GALL_438340 [mine drainage metagenome]|uniref:Uncharacterized protein n=1 Tax=mine drainage metagenome TaxID=410659 RepID=A0A1J5Q3D9_9ZZZZ
MDLLSDIGQLKVITERPSQRDAGFDINIAEQLGALADCPGFARDASDFLDQLKEGMALLTDQGPA